MPSMVVRQPDGRLAVFSSVTESFLAAGMTADEVITWFTLELGEAEAREKVRRGTEDHVPYAHEVRGAGDVRWRYALDYLPLNRGEDAAVAHLRELFGGLADLASWEAYVLERAALYRRERAGERDAWGVGW